MIVVEELVVDVEVDDEVDVPFPVPISIPETFMFMPNCPFGFVGSETLVLVDIPVPEPFPPVIGSLILMLTFIPNCPFGLFWSVTVVPDETVPDCVPEPLIVGSVTTIVVPIPTDRKSTRLNSSHS